MWVLLRLVEQQGLWAARQLCVSGEWEVEGHQTCTHGLQPGCLAALCSGKGGTPAVLPAVTVCDGCGMNSCILLHVGGGHLLCCWGPRG